MSDNSIALIPEDPHFVPDQVAQVRARDQLAQIAPDADAIVVRVFEKPRFFDCAANFGRVVCPSCRAEISVMWWQDRMDDDYIDGFEMARYRTPCCSAAHTLQQLIYEWPQGFGRFLLEAVNPNIRKIESQYKGELERILGTELRVIYKHF